MNAQPILIHVLLASASVPAGPSTAAASEADGRALLWQEIGGQVYARLQPWFDGGWELVPGTLGPHSLQLAPARRISRSLSAWLAGVLLSERRTESRRAPVFSARSVSCLLVRRV